MKKLIFIIGMIIMLSLPIEGKASTKVYERTKDNLRVPNNVEVTDSNLNYILATKAVNAKEKIYDYANILTDEEEKKLYKSVKEYIDAADIDLVFLTEENINGFSPTDYMKNFYDYNKFKKNGIIFFVYMEEKEVQIYMITTGDVTDFYNNERIGDILKYVYNNFSEAKYYDGFDTYVKIVQGYYKMQLEEGGYLKIDDEGNIIKTLPWGDIIILSITLTFIIMFTMFYLFNTKNNDSVLTKKETFNNNLNVRKLGEEFLGESVLKRPKNFKQN